MVEANRSTVETPDAAALEIFQNQWGVYRKFLDHDYLSNREACRALKEFLTADLARPFHFLDLACGDASGIVATLRETPVESYRGVDLSAPALRMAEQNLSTLHAPVVLDEADFTTAMRDRADRADVVWISLSLHHLESDGKLAFMREVREGLRDDGVFLVYEPTRRNGEDREAYLERIDDVGRREWTALSAEEYAEAMNHIRTCDLQETVTGWAELGLEAGFSSVEELYSSPNDLFRLFLYRL